MAGLIKEKLVFSLSVEGFFSMDALLEIVYYYYLEFIVLSRARKGFTMLELIVVIVILGILAAIAIPTFAKVIGKSKSATVKETASAYAHDLDADAAADGVTTLDATSLATYVTDVAGDLPSSATAVQKATTTQVTVTNTSNNTAACVTFGTVGSSTVAAGACA